MGRLVELAPTERMDMKTALHRFTTLLNASAYLQDPAYANELKKRVRVHAYMPSSPLRRAALEALSEQDPAAAQIVAEEKKQKLDALRSQVHKVVHTCCHDR